jgi:hypothetical protein
MCPGVASRPHLLWSVLMRERYPTRGVHGKEKLSSFTVKSSSRTPISSVLPPPPPQSGEGETKVFCILITAHFRDPAFY